MSRHFRAWLLPVPPAVYAHSPPLPLLSPPPVSPLCP
ncbi:hypothetical protein SEA_PUREGLOBE5_126 [Arthrobacter phage Pureglobe5]|nr:hypothetical protein SEA_PUREGLOBE5_126 [Arthrobacter phage Pureglobe5]